MDRRRRVLIASDHNGSAARAYIVKKLSEIQSIELIDLGPGENDGKVDYVDYAVKLIDAISSVDDRGILVCGTGTGMCIAANKHGKYIRAGLATDVATAELMREHNDCQVLCLGQWRNTLSQMDDIVRAFLTTRFGFGRHEKRILKLDALDDKR